MFEKVAFTMYPVQDAAWARTFYEGTLGLTAGKLSSSGVWTEYDLPGGGCLALFATQDIEPSANAGGSIAFEVKTWTRWSPGSRARACGSRPT